MAALILIIDTYIRTLRLWYDYKLERRQQIVAKLKRQVIRALNISVRNIQGQTESIHNLYKDSLDNILDSDINDIVAKTIYTKPGPLKQDTSITQLCTPQEVDILQSLGDFGQVSNRKDKHSSSLTRVKSSPKLSPNIVLPDYSAINTSSISNDWVKRGQPKARAHREIISRPDPLSGSGFYPIHPNLLRSAPDPPPSAPTGSAFDQVQPRASLLIASQP